MLRTHRGLPITLALIYKCVAEGVGLTVRGINSPGHFLAAVQCPEPAAHEIGKRSAGCTSTRSTAANCSTEEDVCRRIAEATGRDDPPSPDWLAPATHRQWLARMLNNLQAVFAHTGRERDLYAMQELQELLVSGSA